MKRPPTFRRGVALLLTIGFVVLLSLLVTGMMASLQVRLVESETRVSRPELRDAAESALAVAMARLAVFESDAEGFRLNAADLDRLGEDPLAGWEPASGASISVSIRDESGRFSLNTRDTTSLRRLFCDLGVPSNRAESLADALADAVDEDDSRRPSGAESADYDSASSPPNRPLTGFTELRRVRGFADTFFLPDGSLNATGRDLAAVCTFLDTGRAPNLNGAPDAVLHLLALRCGGDESALRAWLTPLDYPSDRTHRTVVRSAADLPRAGAPAELGEHVTFGCRAVRVTIRAAKGDLHHDIDALLGPSPGSRTAPVRVLRRSDGGLLAEIEPATP